MDTKQSFISTLFSSLTPFVSIQYRLLVALVQAIDNGEKIDAESFTIIVEDTITDYALPISKAKQLVEESGSFLFDGDFWYYNENFSINGEVLSFEEYKQLLLDNSTTVQALSNNEAQIKASILCSLKWCIKMVRMAIENDMNGLPAFLRCEENDSLIGNKVAGTATPEALSFLCSGISFLTEIDDDSNSLAHIFSFLIKNTLACQCNDKGWDRGGFYPLEDQPEATHPTIDATSIALIALCDFYRNRKKIEEITGSKSKISNDTIQNAVIAGVDFVIRMQQPGGSFGIYRYQDEFLDDEKINTERENGVAQPNDNCTRIALSAMGVCKESGIFDDIKKFEYYERCSGVIKKSYDYLTKHVANVDQGEIWLPYFGVNDKLYTYGDILVSAGRVNRCFIPVWWQMEEMRPKIQEYTSAFAAYWCDVAEKSIGSIGQYEFKTPRKDSYSVVTYNWKSYSDMIAGHAVLQAYNLFNIALTKAEWKTIESALNRVLAQQHRHGHWNLPNTRQPFLAVTVAAYDFLTAYLEAKSLR